LKASNETPTKRRGDNLYPVQMHQEFDGGHSLDLDVPEGVWNPTPHGVHLGNMLCKMDFSKERVLELGTGCGLHAILLARRGASVMTVTEIEEAPLDNARHNIEKHDVRIPVDYQIADWTHVKDDGYDVLVTNPPFAKSGKTYRRYFIDTLILDAHKLLKPGGRLVFVQSSMADIPRSIRLMQECGMSVRVVGEKDGPFRDYYFEDAEYRAEMAAVPGGYSVRDGVHYERLIVFEARLPK